MAMKRHKIRLREVNRHLVCRLCRGYYVDATTIAECLHSFCRSCIIMYLEKNSYCPVCEVQIHKTKPYLNLRLDKALQDVVYKLVPGHYHNEMARRRAFYHNKPQLAGLTTPEQRGVEERLIFSPEDSISLSLEFIDGPDPEPEAPSSQSSESGEDFPMQLGLMKVKRGESIARRSISTDSNEPNNYPQRFLLCPAVVTVKILKKFLAQKFELPNSMEVEILHKRVPLADHYTLMDVAYIFTWKRMAPMRLFYQINKVDRQPPSILPASTALVTPAKPANSVKSTLSSYTNPISVTTPASTNLAHSKKTELPSAPKTTFPLTYSCSNQIPKPSNQIPKPSNLIPVGNQPSSNLVQIQTPASRSSPGTPSGISNLERVGSNSISLAAKTVQSSMPQKTEPLPTKVEEMPVSRVPVSSPVAPKPDMRQPSLKVEETNKDGKVQPIPNGRTAEVKPNPAEVEARKSEGKHEPGLVCKPSPGYSPSTAIGSKPAPVLASKPAQVAGTNPTPGSGLKPEIKPQHKTEIKKPIPPPIPKILPEVKTPVNPRVQYVYGRSAGGLRTVTHIEKSEPVTLEEQSAMHAAALALRQMQANGKSQKPEPKQQVMQKPFVRPEAPKPQQVVGKHALPGIVKREPPVAKPCEKMLIDPISGKLEMVPCSPEKEKKSPKTKSSVQQLKTFRKEKIAAKNSSLTISTMPNKDKPIGKEEANVSIEIKSDIKGSEYDFESSSPPNRIMSLQEYTRSEMYKSKYSEMNGNSMNLQEFRKQVLNGDKTESVKKDKNKTVPSLYRINDKNKGSPVKIAKDEAKQIKRPEVKPKTKEELKVINIQTSDTPIRAENKVKSPEGRKTPKKEDSGADAELLRLLLKRRDAAKAKVENGKRAKTPVSGLKPPTPIDLSKLEKPKNPMENLMELANSPLDPKKDQNNMIEMLIAIAQKQSIEPLLKVPQFPTARPGGPSQVSPSDINQALQFFQKLSSDMKVLEAKTQAEQSAAPKIPNMAMLQQYYMQQIEFVRMLKRQQAMVNEVNAKVPKLSPKNEGKKDETVMKNVERTLTQIQEQAELQRRLMASQKNFPTALMQLYNHPSNPIFRAAQLSPSSQPKSSPKPDEPQQFSANLTTEMSFHQMFQQYLSQQLKMNQRKPVKRPGSPPSKADSPPEKRSPVSEPEVSGSEDKSPVRISPVGASETPSGPSEKPAPSNTPTVPPVNESPPPPAPPTPSLSPPPVSSASPPPPEPPAALATPAVSSTTV